MNRIILNQADDPPNLVGGTFTLQAEDPRYQHLVEHLKIGEGDRVNITVLESGLGKAKIASLTSKEATLEIDSELEKGARRYLHLYVAYSRPPTLKKILEHSVGFPLKSLTFFHGDLAEKSFATSKVLHPEEQRRHLLAGLSQSGAYDDLPTVSTLGDDLEESLKKRPQHPTYYLDRGSKKNLASVSNNPEPLNIFIGSERGWTERERECFHRKEIQKISISKSILRVEMACFVALGQLELLQNLEGHRE